MNKIMIRRDEPFYVSIKRLEEVMLKKLNETKDVWKPARLKNMVTNGEKTPFIYDILAFINTEKTEIGETFTEGLNYIPLLYIEGEVKNIDSLKVDLFNNYGFNEDMKEPTFPLNINFFDLTKKSKDIYSENLVEHLKEELYYDYLMREVEEYQN